MPINLAVIGWGFHGISHGAVVIQQVKISQPVAATAILCNSPCLNPVAAVAISTHVFTVKC